MLDSITHEPFYVRDVVDLDRQGLHVGWTGHGGPFPDGMPLVLTGNWGFAVVTGQVFGTPSDLLERTTPEYWSSIAEQMAGDDVRFHDALGRLNGTFAGVVADARSGYCAIFTDRYGIQRLFHHHSSDGVFFATEAKAILAAVSATRHFDPVGLGEFLACGCTLGRRSLYRDIEVLPGAGFQRFTLHQSSPVHRYFDRSEWEQLQGQLTVPEATSRYIDAFAQTARRFLPASTSVAMSLTGGLDSRMVLAAAGAEPGRLPCYTFRGPYRDSYDVIVARHVAASADQPFHPITVGKDFIRDAPAYFERAVHLSDGYLGMSGAPELFANGVARTLGTVRLTGNYGSETLRGSRAVGVDAQRGTAAAPDLHGHIHEAGHSFRSIVASMPPLSFAVFHQAPHHGFGRLAVEASQVVPRSPFLDNDLLRVCYEAQRALDGTSIAIETLRESAPQLLDLPTDRGLLGSGGKVTRWMRRLHREMLFKGEYLASHGMPDAIARRRTLRALTGMERRLLGRHKFYHLRSLLRDSLEGYTRDLLSSANLPEWVDAGRVRELMDEHYSDRRNHTAILDILLTLTQAQRGLLARFM